MLAAIKQIHLDPANCRGVALLNLQEQSQTLMAVKAPVATSCRHVQLVSWPSRLSSARVTTSSWLADP